MKLLTAKLIILEKHITLGVDIGRSHITAALVDLRSGHILDDSYRRERINAKDSAENIIKNWGIVIKDIINSSYRPVSGIGMAFPGPFNYEDGISLLKENGKYEALYGLNIKSLLAEELDYPKISIKMMNDAACFLTGELFKRDLEGCNNTIGITIGTGLGTAHYKDGVTEDCKLWKSPFLKGKAEDYLSTRWFVKRYKELTGNSVKDIRALLATDTQDPAFETIFDEFSVNLADFLYAFVRKKEALSIVIGGLIIPAQKYFWRKTAQYLYEKMFYSIPIHIAVSLKIRKMVVSTIL